MIVTESKLKEGFLLDPEMFEDGCWVLAELWTSESRTR